MSDVRESDYNGGSGDQGEANRNSDGVTITDVDSDEERREDVVVHLPPMEDASERQERTKVLGYNHIRRTDRDRKEDEIRRKMSGRGIPRRWQKKFRWRIRNDRKSRWFCILFTSSVTALGSMFGLWSLGEFVAAIAVMGTIMLLGFGACIAAEIVIHCPNAVEWLLYDMGFITPYTPLDLPEDMAMHEIGEFEGVEGDPMLYDGTRGVTSEYDVEIGHDQSLSFGSPDIPMLCAPSDYDEKGKPLYGEVAVRANQPIQKVRRAATMVWDAVRGAWEPTFQYDNDEYGDEGEEYESEYERELESMRNKTDSRPEQQQYPDTTDPHSPDITTGPVTEPENSADKGKDIVDSGHGRTDLEYSPSFGYATSDGNMKIG